MEVPGSVRLGSHAATSASCIPVNLWLLSHLLSTPLPARVATRTDRLQVHHFRHLFRLLQGPPPWREWDTDTEAMNRFGWNCSLARKALSERRFELGRCWRHFFAVFVRRKRSSVRAKMGHSREVGGWFVQELENSAILYFWLATLRHRIDSLCYNKCLS